MSSAYTTTMMVGTGAATVAAHVVAPGATAPSSAPAARGRVTRAG